MLGALAAGCGGSSGGSGSASGSTGTAGTSGVVTAGAKLPAGCTRVQDPGTRAGEAHQKRPTGRLSGPATVAMQTNCGAFTITLDVDQAPKTASSFATLVKRGFYDGLTFHRISAIPRAARSSSRPATRSPTASAAPATRSARSRPPT